MKNVSTLYKILSWVMGNVRDKSPSRAKYMVQSGIACAWFVRMRVSKRQRWYLCGGRVVRVSGDGNRCWKRLQNRSITRRCKPFCNSFLLLLSVVSVVKSASREKRARVWKSFKWTSCVGYSGKLEIIGSVWFCCAKWDRRKLCT